MPGLEGLAPHEMRAVATALRAGRLSAPLTPLALARYINRGASAASAALVHLSRDGMSSSHMAFLLEEVAQVRESARSIEDMLELVSTGPEAPGQPMRDTRVVVRDLFTAAQRSVLVAGYAVYQGRDVFQALAERMDTQPGLIVNMYLDVQRVRGDTSSSLEILRRFADRFKKAEWPGSRLPSVFYDPRSLDADTATRTSLHAKCVVLDEEVAFISSANFTEAAQIRNIEVGVLIRSGWFASQLRGHFRGLAERHLLERVPGL